MPGLGAGVGAYLSLIPGASFFDLGALSQDFQIEIGDFTLEGFEEPSKISGGTTQAIKEHVYPGGVRTMDTYGADPAKPTLSGRMMGPTAEERVQALETIVQQGLPVLFSYSQKSMQVLLETLTWDFYNYYDIEFTLTISIITDNGLTNPATIETDIANIVNGDISWLQNSVTGLVGGIF